jgi:hypothetical protein
MSDNPHNIMVKEHVADWVHLKRKSILTCNLCNKKIIIKPSLIEKCFTSSGQDEINEHFWSHCAWNHEDFLTKYMLEAKRIGGEFKFALSKEGLQFDSKKIKE